MVAATSTVSCVGGVTGGRVSRTALPGVWALGEVLPEVLLRYGLELPGSCDESSPEERVASERGQRAMPLLAAGQ